MTIADDAMASRAGAIISRYGKPAQLLRDGVVRDCTAAILGHSPRARALQLEAAEQMLIAAPLAVEPDHELDKVVFGTKLFAIVAPVKGPRPADIAIYYDLDVVHEGTYP